MKFRLLIVDDETTVRRGLVNYMNWASIDCEVCGSASDGSEAIEFLRKNPVDIVITDIKMPDTDGLEVARFVNENCPDTRVILLTGYAEFEYAKTAIQYGVSSFIVKPTNKKDLFAAVQDIQKKLITSKRKAAMAREELEFLKEQLLLEMTQQTFVPSFNVRLREVGLTLGDYCVAVFQPASPGSDMLRLKNLILSEQPNACCYRCSDLMITLYFPENPAGAVPEALVKSCREIADILYTLDSCPILIGISRRHLAAAEYRTAVSEALCALRSNFYSQDPISCFSGNSMELSCEMTVENSLDLCQLENYLHNRLFEEANALSDRLFLKLKNNFVHSQDVRNICSQIYYICSRLLIAKGQDTLSPDYLAEINDASNIFSLQNTVQDLLHTSIVRLQSPMHLHSQPVNESFRYIREHLSEPLSLEIISGALHVSPSHLSRVFKRECGESLTEYINRTRIDKAREYLEQSDLLIYEIAEKTGYNDVAYFSSIFKKYTGASPTSYRAKRRTSG